MRLALGQRFTSTLVKERPVLITKVNEKVNEINQVNQNTALVLDDDFERPKVAASPELFQKLLKQRRYRLRSLTYWRENIIASLCLTNAIWQKVYGADQFAMHRVSPVHVLDTNDPVTEGYTRYNKDLKHGSRRLLSYRFHSGLLMNGTLPSDLNTLPRYRKNMETVTQAASVALKETKHWQTVYRYRETYRRYLDHYRALGSGGGGKKPPGWFKSTLDDLLFDSKTEPMAFVLFGILALSGLIGMTSWTASKDQVQVPSKLDQAMKQNVMALEDQLEQLQQYQSKRMQASFQQEQILNAWNKSLGWMQLKQLFSQEKQSKSNKKVSDYLSAKEDDVLVLQGKDDRLTGLQTLCQEESRFPHLSYWSLNDATFKEASETLTRVKIPITSENLLLASFCRAMSIDFLYGLDIPKTSSQQEPMDRLFTLFADTCLKVRRDNQSVCIVLDEQVSLPERERYLVGALFNGLAERGVKVLWFQP